MAASTGMELVKTLKWDLQSFSTRYFPQQVDPLNSKKVLAPARLRKPYPESNPGLLNLSGNRRINWVLKLHDRIPSDGGCGIELSLFRCNMNERSSQPRFDPGLGQEVVALRCRLSLATGSDNLTVYCTDTVILTFKQGHSSATLGWPKGLSNKAKSIAVDQKHLIHRDDVLRVRVEYCEATPNDFIVTPWKSLENDMEKLWETGQNADITIKCGSETLQAHKLILSLRSPVFSAMLTSDMMEANSGVITIKDLEPIVLKRLLLYMYTAKIDLSGMEREGAIGLIHASEKYQLTGGIKDLCFSKLLANVDINTCGELAVLAYLHKASNYHRTVLFDFISKHWSIPILAGNAEFQKLIKNYPAAFFKPEP